MSRLRGVLRQIVNLAGGLDLYNVRFIPDGAGEPNPSLPVREVVITPADVENARREWAELFPDYVGLLDADVEGQREFDG